jgi:hypothetical protein
MSLYRDLNGKHLLVTTLEKKNYIVVSHILEKLDIDPNQPLNIYATDSQFEKAKELGQHDYNSNVIIPITFAVRQGNENLIIPFYTLTISMDWTVVDPETEENLLCLCATHNHFKLSEHLFEKERQKRYRNFSRDTIRGAWSEIVRNINNGTEQIDQNIDISTETNTHDNIDDMINMKFKRNNSPIVFEYIKNKNKNAVQFFLKNGLDIENCYHAMGWTLLSYCIIFSQSTDLFYLIAAKKPSLLFQKNIRNGSIIGTEGQQSSDQQDTNLTLDQSLPLEISVRQNLEYHVMFIVKHMYQLSISGNKLTTKDLYTSDGTKKLLDIAVNNNNTLNMLSLMKFEENIIKFPVKSIQRVIRGFIVRQKIKHMDKMEQMEQMEQYVQQCIKRIIAKSINNVLSIQ